MSGRRKEAAKLLEMQPGVLYNEFEDVSDSRPACGLYIFREDRGSWQDQAVFQAVRADVRPVVLAEEASPADPAVSEESPAADFPAETFICLPETVL